MINKVLIKKILFICIFLCMYLICNSVFASNLSNEDLLCTNDILMDLDSGNILYGKNENNKIYPASTTKILTAILALENLELDEKVIVSKKAVNMIPYQSSVMGVKAGEIYTVEDLLYGLMLPSGNDAAIVLAEKVSGNVDDFVVLMNNKLKELGINNTHFTNPHGYHDDNHYSTSVDMANLFRYCLQNDTFKKIISTLEYTIPPTNLNEDPRKLRNTNRISDPEYTKIYYEYILGGKTGYTIEANGTFVGYGSKDGKNIIVCAFNGSQNVNGGQARFLDTKELAMYAFNNFEQNQILNKDKYKFKIYDSKNMKYYFIGLNENVNGLFKKDENVIVDYNITADINTLSLLSSSEETSINNSIIGKLNVFNKDGKLINTFDLVYLGSGTQIQYKSEYNIFVIPIIVILLLIVLIALNKNNKKRDRSRSRNKYKNEINF